MDAFLIDGPGLVHANFPQKSMKTFDAYCKEQLAREIDYLVGHAERIDLVFDVYREVSIKNDTTEGRSNGEVLRALVRGDTPIQHAKFNKFLLVNQNKTEILTCKTTTLTCTRGKKLSVTLVPL